MAKKIFTMLASAAMLLVVGYYLVQYYIAHFYDDPGAVSARELRMTNEEVSNLKKNYSVLERGEDIVICVNPSHGGYDRGASVGTLMEKDITLDVALALVRLDTEEDGIQIKLTRYEDTAPTMEQRMEIVSALKPDIFVDLFVSESDDNQIFGTTTCYRDKYYDYRLNDAELADMLERNVVISIEGKALGVTDDWRESSVLDEVNMISAGISLGYITSELEGDAMTSPAYLNNLAQGIYNGLIEAAQRLMEQGE